MEIEEFSWRVIWKHETCNRETVWLENSTRFRDFAMKSWNIVFQTERLKTQSDLLLFSLRNRKVEQKKCRHNNRLDTTIIDSKTKSRENK